MWSTVLWITQIVLAVLMLLAGTLKLVMPRERLAQRMHWASSWPRGRIKLLGAAEAAGAFGVVLPIATGIAPFLTPVAAVCLAVLMAGAIRTHVRLGERPDGAVVAGVLSVVVAIGRGSAFIR